MKTVDPLQFLQDELRELSRRDLLRADGAPPSVDELSFCSNDYLGFACLQAPPVASGSGASRLIAGDREEHRALERSLAQWLGLEDALAFTSGYAANVGVLSALARPGDLIVSDALNHASIIDGARLSKARVAIVPHVDVRAIDDVLARREEARAFVVVESYFSMDADGPDLADLRRVCDARGAALIVDEAHALGVLGPGGRGRCAEAAVVPDVLVGTLGKALGSQGAFAAGRSALRSYLWNRARSFVFSTGLAPVSAAAASRALARVQERPYLGRGVVALAVRMRERLSAGRVPTLGFGHVVPVVIGEAARAMSIAHRLRADGIAVQAVRPPTVPPETSRIRLTVTAAHGAEDVDRAASALTKAFHS